MTSVLRNGCGLSCRVGLVYRDDAVTSYIVQRPPDTARPLNLNTFKDAIFALME